MADKILVPTDGSKPSDNALEYAAKLAKLYESELLVLKVISTGVATTYHGVSIKEKLMEELEGEAKRILGRSVNTAKSLGVNAEGIIKRGLPDKEIIALAKEREDIALVVMGAYGKNFIERQLVGSKTERVLRGITELDVPLVIVQCPCREFISESDRMPKKILVPTDGSEPSDNALEYAAKLAKLSEGELLVLNVIKTSILTTPRQGSIKEKLEEELKERAKNIVERSVNTAKSLGVNAEGIIKHGLPDKEIIALAKEREDIALVVMGAYGKNFIERRLVGSQTERVLRGMTEIKVPLVAVPCPCKK